MQTDYPNSVYDIISQTFEVKKNDDNVSFHNCLLSVLKIHHMWPSLQVKKFKNNEHLVLLHNSYDMKIVDEKFSHIYNQCRSIILDFSLYLQNNVVVSYANNIPIRMSVDEYSQNIVDNDQYQEAYDGTMITVYNYKDEWYFGTSTCTDVNYSRFSHQTKSHGDMLNETLMMSFRSYFSDEEIASGDKHEIEKKLRRIFTDSLDKSLAYEFVLLHHENKHIIDYSDMYGMDYKRLVHINSKNRETLCEIDVFANQISFPMLHYPLKLSSFQEAHNHIVSTKTYGFIVKRNTEIGVQLFKISPQEITLKEETDPCKPNIWHSILSIYMKNNKDYKIVDYIEMYQPNMVLPKDDKGRDIDATYLIHTVISTLKDFLYNIYCATTTYNPKTNRFRMNKELDMQFAPIIRFHLAQLRHRQITNHVGTVIKPTDVYYYICKCNNIKNIKLLVSFFSTNETYNTADRATMCLKTLNDLL